MENSKNEGAPSNVPTAFQDMGFKPDFDCFSDRRKNTTLSWKNIGLKIKDRQVLSNVTGQVLSGTVCALMGPSGAGKTSLMNILSGRLLNSKTKSIRGEVYVNGNVVDPTVFQSNIAYVMQEDLLFATATAREALEFSAKMRLPAVVAKNKVLVKAIVDGLLDSLGLTHVQNTRIGSERSKGLSGGEKKRVAIGVELVTNPSLLFLDEPTSGLDSVAAWKVVQILRSLGKATGCAIMCTIHQPSSEIFGAFDKVMMLAQGGVMYNGPVASLTKSFEDFGKPVPANTNPADFLLLVAQTSDESKVPRINYDENLDMEETKLDESPLLRKKEKRIGLLSEAFILAKREAIDVKRDLMSLVVVVFINAFLGGLYGAIFYEAADRENDDFSFADAQGVLTLIVISLMFGSAEGPLLTFPLERGVFLREYRTGTYSAISYFAAKLLIEIPISLISPVVMFLVTYFTLGLQGNLIFLIMIGWLLCLTIASYAILLGSIITDPETAQQFSTLILVPQLLFSGLFAPLDVIPPFLNWAQYVCVFKYALNLFFIEENNDCDFSEDEIRRLPGLVQNCTFFFEANDVDSDLIYRDIGVLFGIFAVVRILSVVVLVWRSKTIE